MKNKLNKYTITNTMKRKEIIINNNFQNFHIKENTRKRNKIIKNIKWKKILLSCLFNNYYPNYTHTTLHKNKKQNTTLRKPWSEKILNTEQEIIKNKQSTLWLGKTHDFL